MFSLHFMDGEQRKNKDFKSGAILFLFFFKTSKSFSNLRQSGDATSVHEVIKDGVVCCLWARARVTLCSCLSAHSSQMSALHRESPRVSSWPELKTSC